MGVEAGPPSPAPSSAPLPSLRHRHESICRSNTTTTRRDLNDRQLEERKLLRRNSTAIYSKPLPPSPLLQPPSPPPQSQTAQSDLDRKSAAEFRNQLRAWSHIYYGNATTADAFVIARSLQQRRHSISTAAPAAAVSSPTSLEHQRQCQNKHQHRRFWHHGSAFSSKGGGRGGGDSASPGNSQPQPLPLPTRLTVRTIIRPRDPERQPFLLQRNFDLNALRATVPDSVGGSHVPSPRPQTQIQDCVSYPSPRSSASVSSSSFSPAGVGGDGRRRSSPVGPEGLRAPQRPPLARRRTSLKSSELLSGRGVGTEATSDVAVDYESLVLDPRAVPVRKWIMPSSSPFISPSRLRFLPPSFSAPRVHH